MGLLILLKEFFKMKFPNIKQNATNEELLGPAMEIAKSGDEAVAKEYFDALCKHYMRFGGIVNREVAEKNAHDNLGYWAGYYDHDTRKAVKKVFGSSHPIFGDTFPTPEEAFKIGMELGNKLKLGK